MISHSEMLRLTYGDAPEVDSNFGVLEGGWLRVQINRVGLDQLVIGYASDAIVASAQASDPNFQGLAGLPLLRQIEYGGDADAFWLR